MSAYNHRRPVIVYDRANENDWRAQPFHERGERAPWEKVYDDGRDITDEPPETWPWPWSAYYAGGWRPWQPPSDGDQ